MWKYRRSRQSIHRERSQPEIWKRERREGFRPGSPLSRLRHAEKSVHNTGPALSSAKGKARVGGVNRIENSRPVSDSSSSTVTHPPIESSSVKSRTNLRKDRFPPAFYGKPVTISDIFSRFLPFPPAARRIGKDFSRRFRPIFSSQMLGRSTFCSVWQLAQVILYGVVGNYDSGRSF